MKLWKGRFTKEENSFADEFNSSIDVDCRMWAQDIRGSIAHAKMLSRQGIIPEDDSIKIVQGLERILHDMESGLNLFEPGDEDIHMAVELGFSGLCPNSMDAVSDRDFALEFLSCCSICMMHLSRFCEELILWNTPDFGFIEMDDAFATGSSIMPQKKNPDMAELVRGKTGRVYGDLMSLLTVMKGLPLAYNKDMQEDKEPVFDAGDTLKDCLTVFTAMLDTIPLLTKEKWLIRPKAAL